MHDLAVYKLKKQILIGELNAFILFVMMLYGGISNFDFRNLSPKHLFFFKTSFIK